MPASVQQTEQPAAIRARSRTTGVRAPAALGKTVREKARTSASVGSDNVVPSRAASRGLVLRDITNNDGGRGIGGKAFGLKAGSGKLHSSAHLSAQPAGCCGYGRSTFTEWPRPAGGYGGEAVTTDLSPRSACCRIPAVASNVSAEAQGQVETQAQAQVLAQAGVQSQAKSAPRGAFAGTEVMLDVCDADVGEYLPDIMDQYFCQEVNLRLKPSYMEAQLDINGKMRGILVDWLVEVHMKYKLRRETLYLTVRLIDRYLSQQTIARKHLQLVGVCAMLIGAKFEEIQPPEVHDFVYITDKAYTKKDILDMERAMLQTLSFKIVAPTEAHFLDPLMCANRCDDQHRELAQYLLELALHDLKMILYLPSHLVAAALLLSNELLDRRSVWPASMARASRWEAADLRVCASELRALLVGAASSPLQAVRKKYGSEHHKSVAKMLVGTAWVA